MQNKKIKIAMVTNHFGITGISTVILNYCKALPHDRFDLTVIAGRPIAEDNREECKQNAIELIELPPRHQESMKHYWALWRVLKKGRYDIVHIHGSSSMMAIELTIAKLAGVKIRIAHSHNSACPNMKVHRILNPYFRKIYTKALACGVLAGNWLYGQNQFEVLPNGFHTRNFIFDSAGRKRVRTKLEIENNYVIGHIGRFNEQKNQQYLLKVFESAAELRKDAVLLLVGTGPDFEKIKASVDIHPYKERIILYGITKDTSAIYSAIDCFALPSRYEGLPVVLLEAQISGLPCIVSDKVTKEMDFGNICWESIDADPKIWAKRILDTHIVEDSDRQGYYKNHNEQIKEYDIDNTVKQLERIYMKGINTMPTYEGLRLKMLKYWRVGLAAYRKKKLIDTDFTIISNNCWGGTVYEAHNLPKMSPTVGCFFMAEDYIKFLSNLKGYLGGALSFITLEESRWKSAPQVSGGKKAGSYPIGVLTNGNDNVEIFFLHYHSEQEAREKWERRCKRVNWDRLLVKFNDQIGCTEKEVKDFMGLPFRNKLFFTCKKWPESIGGGTPLFASFPSMTI